MLQFQFPATLGSDLAGVVVEAGSRVTRLKPGDAVFASIFDLGTGTLAEFAVVPENAAAHKPANLDFVRSGLDPMVGLTSWQALKSAQTPARPRFSFAGSGGMARSRSTRKTSRSKGWDDHEHGWRGWSQSLGSG